MEHSENKKPGSVLSSLFLAVVLLVVSPLAASAWYFEIDNTDGDNVIEIWFRTEGETVTWQHYDLGLAFDYTEISFSSEWAHNLPDTFNARYSPGTYEYKSGYYWSFYGENGNLTLSEDYLIGTHTINVLDGAVQDGVDDIYWGNYVWDSYSPLDFHVEVDGIQYEPSDTGNDQVFRTTSGLDFGAPVPLPSAVWMLGSAVFGLLGLKRRRNKHLNI